MIVSGGFEGLEGFGITSILKSAVKSAAGPSGVATAVYKAAGLPAPTAASSVSSALRTGTGLSPMMVVGGALAAGLLLVVVMRSGKKKGAPVVASNPRRKRRRRRARR
jgi:hypothetical protein